MKLYLGIDGRPMGSTMFRLRDDMMWESVPGKNKMKVEKDDLQSVLTVYCSLMALMTYAVPPESEQTRTVHKESHKPTRAKIAKPQKHITYIIRHSNGTILAAPRGSHASPTGVFTVRGHFRHYKSGKVVWIAEYRKGEGKKKKKTYKDICKSWRGADNVDHIAEEIADVEIMPDQLKMMTGSVDMVKTIREKKLRRLERRLDEYEKKGN